MISSPSSAPPLPRAVLGPTNTGKTWYALERMLGHASGMFGFPLRLLARENYDRAVAKMGSEAVALMTGEEKIIPPNARYFLCTVEAMPLDRKVDFLAVDEVQLAADPERGHVFTDKILHARGREETLLLGAETMRKALEQILPGISIDTRQRLSRLTWAGHKKVTRLPRRSGVVAFSAAEVYRLAELVRAQRGGTAIVMGALSPRTRNAQVELFQSGAVDYMVATDAIGMGLNMDIDHIALAGSVKFDGRRSRRLTPAELAQIAGRAGRHTADGTFGITDTCKMLDADVIDAIENHRFEYLSGVFWRNSDVSFASLGELLASLEARPPMSLMTRKSDADDQRALVNLMGLEDVRVRAHGEEQVALLYEICQIPDYQREYSDNHTALLAQIYLHLAAGDRLPRDWVANALQRLNRTEGGIDALMARLSAIRTWSYITQRVHWLDEAVDFQALARSIEDRVSDRLHQVLMDRFVDHRATVLTRRLKEKTPLMASVKNDGTVIVEGQEVGRLDGFTFTPVVGESDEKATILAAARKALGDEIGRRTKAILASADEAFKPDREGQIFWRDEVVGRFIKGDSVYQPKVALRIGSLLDGVNLTAVQDRLNNFALAWPGVILEKAVALDTADLTGAVRGIAYQVFEGLGTVPSPKVAKLLSQIDEDGRRQLANQGIRLGVDMIYMADLLKSAQIEARALLFSVYTGEMPDCGPPAVGRVAFNRVAGVSDDYWLATGYRCLGGMVIRVDMAERIAVLVRGAARGGAFRISDEMLSLAGATREQMEEIIVDLGYVKIAEEAPEDATKPAVAVFEKPKPQKRPQRRSPAGKIAHGDKAEKPRKNKRIGKPRQQSRQSGQSGAINPHSPFAVLASLKSK